MLIFNKIGVAVFAASLAVFLAACATDVPSPVTAQQAAAEPLPLWASAPIAPLVTNLASMRAALPDFAFRDVSDREVSVEMLAFDHDSPFLSSAQVKRIALLQTYLRNNPTVAVRVEGYFGAAHLDGPSSLALDRAQAIARALLTDMRIQNGISAVAAPQHASGTNQAAIILISEQELDSLGLPIGR